MRKLGDIIKDFGSEPLERREEVCEKHGAFESGRFPACGKNGIWSKCPVCLGIEMEEDAEKNEEGERTRERERWAETLKTAGIPRRFWEESFDTYIPEDEKQQAAKGACVQYSKAVAERKAGALFLCGTVGTGKSHLGCSILLSLMGQGDGFRGRYVSVMRMIREIRATYSRDAEKNEQDIIDYFTDLHLLVLDEVGVQLGTQAEKLLLFEVINGRYENERPTVLVSNLNVNGIGEYLGERSIDRLRENGGSVVAFTWPSYRNRKENRS
jgi:DNA replication protein DnaC